MELIVQKYGGTSVGDMDRIRKVAERVIRTVNSGNSVVVVLSAMSGVTDTLLKMAHEASEYPDKREMDVLLATGEQTTVALLSMMLNSMGQAAISLLGYQANIMTNDDSMNARIQSIGAQKIANHLEHGKVVVIPGFQGQTENGDITTLGRGGSDTSAVAIAAAMDAHVCEIYTDVDGIYTTDPRICDKARKLDIISYDEILEMASLGAKVLQIRSVGFAKKYNVPVHVRSSFNEEEGTMVVKDYTDMEKIVISGVTADKNQSRLTIKKVPDIPGISAKIFGPLAEEGIIVDVIIQNTRADGETDVTFTVPSSDFERAVEVSEKVVSEVGGSEVLVAENIAKVSVIGVGMKNHSGVAAKMFKVLADENINIRLITTSEIRISCVIEKKYTELAVQVLHSAFGLDKTEE